MKLTSLEDRAQRYTKHIVNLYEQDGITHVARVVLFTTRLEQSVIRNKSLGELYHYNQVDNIIGILIETHPERENLFRYVVADPNDENRVFRINRLVSDCRGGLVSLNMYCAVMETE